MATNKTIIVVSTVQELLAAISKGDRLIKLEPGNYYVSGLTFGRSNITLQSNVVANRSRIICTANSSSDMILASGKSDISILDLILDGNFKNQKGAVRGKTGPRLGRMRGCRRVLIQRVHLCNGSLDGIRFDTLTDGKLLDNTCELLGHDTFYIMYGSENVLVEGNVFDINTNSGTRVSYGGTNIVVKGNEYFSKNVTSSTGPCVQFDKCWSEEGIGFTDIVISGNKMHNTRGSGIWAIMDAKGMVDNFQIVENEITTTGQYDEDYNGYSHGGIVIGRIPAVIKGNVITDTPNALIVNEYKYPGTETYVITFSGNEISNCDVGVRVDTPRGLVKGTGNTMEKVGTKVYGVTKNVDLSSGGTGPETNDEVDPIKAEVVVTDANGRKGTQTLTMRPDSSTGGTSDITTVKLSMDGRCGDKTFTLPLSVPEGPTGTDWLVDLTMTINGIVTHNKFILPTIQGTGPNTLKYRTKNGVYCQGDLSITLSDPDPVDNPEDDEDVTPDKVNVCLTVRDASGKVGTQTIKVVGEKQTARTVKTTLVTTKLSIGGSYGKMNVEVPMDGSTAVVGTGCTDDDLDVTIELSSKTRGSGIVKFVMPMVSGTGPNELKFRTPDGYYGEIPLNVVLKEPETEPNGENDVTVTVSVTGSIGTTEVLHATQVSEGLTIVDGTTVNVEFNVDSSDGYSGTLTGVVTLKKE